MLHSRPIHIEQLHCMVSYCPIGTYSVVYGTVQWAHSTHDYMNYHKQVGTILQKMGLTCGYSRMGDGRGQDGLLTRNFCLCMGSYPNQLGVARYRMNGSVPGQYRNCLKKTGWGSIGLSQHPSPHIGNVFVMFTTFQCLIYY